MDTIIMREEPLMKKCCFIIPLRMCLQTWGLIKLALEILATTYLAVFSVWVFSFDDFFKRPSAGHLIVLLIVAILIDIVFLFCLTAGIIKKSYEVLRVFFYYEFYVVAVETAIIIFISVMILQAGIGPLGILLVLVGILYIVLDVCIIIIVKSEMVKLRNKGQYDFSRMSSDCEESGKFTADDVPVLLTGTLTLHQLSNGIRFGPYSFDWTMIFANAAGMMREDQPRVNKCCFPLPMKMCFQSWAYAKIITDLILLVTAVAVLVGGLQLSSLYPMLVFLSVFLVDDVGFQVISIIGVHMKNYIALRSFFFYEVLAIVTDFILLPLILYITNNEQGLEVKTTVIILVVGMYYILIDVCLVAKVKKEIMKIHHKYDLTNAQD